MNCLITIATYEESKPACFLKEILENENIDCYLAYSFNLETNVEEIQFQVKEEDVQHAIKIMLKIKETYGKQIEEMEPTHKPYRILVPTDFSAGSEYACQYALQVAKKLSAEVKILHVYENPIVDVSVKESATFEAYALHLRKERKLQISATLIKELREKTSAGVMDCRNALLETEGDLDKAGELLLARGLAKAEKKAERGASQGLIEAYIHPGGRLGALIELNCETDFVAHTDEFKALAHNLTLQIVASDPQFISAEEVPEGRTRKTTIREFLARIKAVIDLYLVSPTSTPPPPGETPSSM